jgi:general secretion pathway protein F
MKTYEYRGFDRGGRACKGLVEALSVKGAREKLAEDGILAEKVAVSGRRRRFPLELRVVVYRELSALLSAGVPVERALEILIESPEMLALRPLLAGVRDRVREGGTLADAFGEASRGVTPMERAVIEAAERSARVEEMLDRLASFLEERSRLRARVVSALVYPSVVVSMGICVAVLMLGVLLPRAREILAAGAVPLPALTRFVLAAGGVAVRAGPLLLAAGLAAFVYARRRLARDAEFLRAWDRRLFSLPLVGRGYGILVNLHFARTLAMLVGSGVPIIEGMVLAGRATGSAWLACMAEAEAESVKHGSSLADAVRRIPPLAGTLPGWIQVGESGGGMARLLNSAGASYREQWERFSSRCLTSLEPILVVVIGAFVLIVTMSVVMPVVSFSQAVTQ